MRPVLKKILLIALLLWIVSSVCLAKSNLHYFWDSLVDGPHSHWIQLRDGEKTLYYTFNIGKQPPDTIIFFFGGSATNSIRYYIKDNLKSLHINATVYGLQKRHVGNWRLGNIKEYDQDNYFEKWIEDDSYFINSILKTATPCSRIIAYGASEGGTRALLAALKFNEITHLIILGYGGLPLADELKILSRKGSLRLSSEVLDSRYRAILNDPENIEQFSLGSPYKYWSHILYFEPLPSFLQINKPIFVAISENDKSTPIESGYFLRDKFQEFGKHNLFFLEVKGCGHNFDDNYGLSHFNEVFQAIDDWLSKSPVE